MNTYKERLWVCVTVIALKMYSIMHIGTVETHGSQHKAILIEVTFWVNEVFKQSLQIGHADRLS